MRRMFEPIEPSETIWMVPIEPSARHVCTAAELERAVAGFYDTDVIAVLLVEEGDRAELVGMQLAGLIGAHRRVGENLGVHHLLHLVEFGLRDARMVAEVEAQVLGVHEGALLLHVLAQHLAQGPVEQVRSGVVAADGVAPGDVDRGGGFLTGRDSALGDDAAVTGEAGDGRGRIGTADGAGRRRDRAGVADLAAALGIERRAIEENLNGVLAVLTLDVMQRQHAGGPFDLGVAGELRRAELLEQLAVARAAASSLVTVLRLSRARRRCSSIAVSKPGMSTSAPRSAAISRVSSIGKPKVSCSWNATAPVTAPSFESSASSRIFEPLASVWRKRSSSRPRTVVIQSWFLRRSGYASPITSTVAATRSGMISFSVPSW